MALRGSSIRRLTIVPACGLALVGLAGCGSDEEATSSRPAVKADLTGRVFLATSASHHEFVENVEAGIGFSDDSGKGPKDSMSLFGVCNPSFGSYSVADGRLQRGSASSTLAACIEPAGLMEQEEWLNAFLDASPKAQIREQGNELVLSTSAERVTFTAKP